MEIVYSSERHPLAEGRTLKNPRHFHGVEDGATKVYVVGDHPKVVAAYRKIGVTVEKVDQNAPAVAAPTAPVEPLPEDFQLPDDWKDMDWQELRRLAMRCGAPFAINRVKAIEIIEDWLLKPRPGEDDDEQEAVEE